jgi:transposase
MINRRMHFICLKAKGYSVEMIADILFVTRKTIWDWEKRYQTGGLKALTTFGYKGQPSQLNQYGKQLVFEFMKHPVATLKEAQHLIEQRFQLKRSLTQIWAFFQRRKLKRRKVGQIPAKADIAAQNQFKQHTLVPLLRQALQQQIKLFFVDGAHFVHQPFLGYLYGLKRLFIRSAAGRQRYNVLGALEAISKAVTTICNHSYINAETVCQLLEALAAQYISQPIYVILDNARYQKCQLVMATALRLNITLVFLPAYSPNLNLIERLWRFIKKKVLYNKFYRVFDEFKNAIISCLDHTQKPEYQIELDSLLTLNFQSFDMLQTNP